MADLADGLQAILDAEHVPSCAVLAGSFGGMIAQVFVRRYGDHVSKLILSTTTAPNPAGVAPYTQQQKMVADAPEQIVMQMAKDHMYELIDPPETEAAFWQAYLDELYTQRLNKADVLSTYDCIIDYMTNYDFQPDDLKRWHGEILILDSDNDAVFDASARDEVNRLYPQAHSHTFSGAGHSPASHQRDVYFQIVRKFLLE